MNNDRRALLFGLAAVLTWSTVATAFKLSLRYMEPLQLLLLANGFSLVALGIVLAVQGRLHLLLCATGKQYRNAALLGALNPFLYYLVLFEGYDRLPAQIAQPVNFTWALTMAWLSVPLLGQKLRWRDAIAGLVCYSGVVILSTGGHLRTLHVDDPIGLVCVLVSTLIWSLYWIFNRRCVLDPVVGLFLGFLFALPLTFVATLIGSDLSIPARGWLGGAYVGAFEMGFTFVLWLTAMKLTSSTARIANLIFLAPFLSLVFIHFVLGEHVVAATFGGLVLIVVGLWGQQASRPREG